MYIQISTGPLPKRDIEYVRRICEDLERVFQHDLTSKTIKINVPFVGTAQQIALRLITCGIPFYFGED